MSSGLTDELSFLIPFAVIGIIPKEHWRYPDWIDIKKANASRIAMKKEGIIYGGSESYRHMCR